MPFSWNAAIWLLAIDTVVSQSSVLVSKSSTPTIPNSLPPTPTATTQSVVLTGFDLCVGTMPNDIYAGWSEFEKMVPYYEKGLDDGPDVRSGYIWLKDWDTAPAVEFFGPYHTSSQCRTVIGDNPDRLAAAYRGYLTFYFIHVRYDDPLRKCLADPSDPKNPTQEDKAAYQPLTHISNPVPQVIKNGAMKNHLNFCPLWFSLPKLDDRIDAVVGGNGLVRDVLDNYWNQAAVIAHELPHISRIGSVVPPYGGDNIPDIPMPYPGTDIRAYRTIDAKYLTFSRNTPFYHVNNVNNYIRYRLATYIINKHGFYPSRAVWNTTMDPPPMPSPGA